MLQERTCLYLQPDVEREFIVCGNGGQDEELDLFRERTRKEVARQLANHQATVMKN